MSAWSMACLREPAMGSAIRSVDLALCAGEFAWEISSRALRGIAELCRRHRRDPREPRPGEESGAGLEDLLRRRGYVPATARRYRQIAEDFGAWAGREQAAGREVDSAAGYLAEVASRAKGDRDPRHLALCRTTVCALRSAVDRPFGLDLTAGMRLPPHPPVRPAASPSAVAALRAAARDDRELLLVVLAAELGLRPGEMAGLQRGDICIRGDRVSLAGTRRSPKVAIGKAGIAALGAAASRGAAGEYVFPSTHHGGSVPVTVRTLQNALRHLGVRAGIDASVTFTSLRKACPLPRALPPSVREGASTTPPAEVRAVAGAAVALGARTPTQVAAGGERLPVLPAGPAGGRTRPSRRPHPCGRTAVTGPPRAPRTRRMPRQVPGLPARSVQVARPD